MTTQAHSRRPARNLIEKYEYLKERERKLRVENEAICRWEGASQAKARSTIRRELHRCTLRERVTRYRAIFRPWRAPAQQWNHPHEGNDLYIPALCGLQVLRRPRAVVWSQRIYIHRVSYVRLSYIFSSLRYVKILLRALLTNLYSRILLYNIIFYLLI